jgi:hypothetical protein
LSLDEKENSYFLSSIRKSKRMSQHSCLMMIVAVKAEIGSKKIIINLTNVYIQLLNQSSMRNKCPHVSNYYIS